MMEIFSGRCRRCGTCCRKGGPSLHLEDRHLVDRGRIPISRLYTIRKGEPALDNVAGRVIPVEDDLIKIKGAGNTWVCVFYDDVLKGCAVYDDRPMECRVLKCWDTGGIESVYRSNRMTREDLLGGIEGLWDMISEHQDRCRYDEVRALLPGVREQDPASVRKLQEMILYDLNLRNLVAEKGLASMEMTDFLFGRPLADTLKPMGVVIVDKRGRPTPIENK